MEFDTWHQGDPYNTFVPLDPNTGSRSDVGCVATAIAQTLEYWDFPEDISFSDSVDSYTTPLGVDIDDDHLVYDFPGFTTLNSHLDQISYPLTGADPALVSFAAGIKVDMQYSSSGSGAWFSDKTFEELGFGSADTSYNWDASTRDSVIDNLMSGLPVVIGVFGTRDSDGRPAGHAVVLEGYRTDNGGEFLINLGWVGHVDEWHSLPNFQTGGYTWDTVGLVVYNIQEDPSWSQAFGDAENTSRSSYGAPTSARLRWKVSEPGWGRFDHVTVAAGGNLHASYKANGDSGKQSSLWIIDEQGTKVREISLGSVNEGIGSTVQDKKGYIYVPTTDGRIYKVNPQTGSASQIWVVPDSNPDHRQLYWLKMDEVNGNERIFTASPNTVYCLTRSGSLVWQKQLPISSTTPYPQGYDTFTLAVDNSRGKVYVPYYDDTTPHLAVLDVESGLIVPHDDLFPDEGAPEGARIGVPSIGSDGTVYIGSNTTLYAFTPNLDGTLTRKWAHDRRPSYMAHTDQPPTIGRDGTVFVSYMLPDYTGYAVAALDADTGIDRWEIPFQLDVFDGDGIGAISAAANDIVAFSVNYENGSANDTHHVYAYRDLGGSSNDPVWDMYVGVNGGGIALGPGDTLYSIPTSFETTTSITALGSGQLGLGEADNQAPIAASDPGIPPGTVIEGTSANLEWTDSDPDGHDLTYTVFLGTADAQTGLMRPIATDLPNPTYVYDDLDPGETYLWKILATDGQATTEGPTWTFSTVGSSVAVDPKIVSQPTVFDDPDTGEVGTPPSDEEWIDEWTPHWVEIWVSDQDGSNGMGSASLDLAYMGSVFTATTIEFGPAFTEGQQQSIDDQNGVVSLSASTTRTDVGDDRPALFARVHLTVEEHDQGLDRDESTKYTEYVQPVSIGVGASNIEVVFSDSRAADVEPVGLPSTALWPVMYDIDDNGEIGAGDIGFFITALERAFSNPESPLLWADFDHSGSVGAGDIGLLVPNLFSFSHQDRVSYDPDFPKPEIWGQLLMVEPSQAARFDAAWLTSDELASTAIAAMERLDNGRENGISLSPDSIEFEIADLPGEQLGQTIGDRILIDTDAAGYGWFVDATPYDDEEYEPTDLSTQLAAVPGSPASERVDLLTVVMHELGHVAGLSHIMNGSFMDPVLPLGVRRLEPGEADRHDLTNASASSPDIPKSAGRLLVSDDILAEILSEAEKDSTIDWAHDEFFALLGE